ncbi:MAG: hypothetical protein CVU34_05710 [Betaproteobacteria bacterium HGW-Betaproteobacteria-7]|nr:MAG: hypothetical protein CVU34_05710 [Betaproteobacteria bacterium HGW-Betaproteobacteria-7]
MNFELIVNVSRWLWELLANPKFSAVASSLGALISVRVWFSLREIRQKVLFRQRAPEIAEAIKGHASNLSAFLQDFDSSSEAISTEIALALEQLKAAAKKLNGTAKGSVNDAIGAIKSFQKLPEAKPPREKVRHIYTQLLSSATAIELMVADSRLEV